MTIYKAATSIWLPGTVIFKKYGESIYYFANHKHWAGGYDVDLDDPSDDSALRQWMMQLLCTGANWWVVGEKMQPNSIAKHVLKLSDAVQKRKERQVQGFIELF